MYVWHQQDIEAQAGELHVKRLKKNHFAMLDPHRHDDYEINFITEGERFYFIHDSRYHLKKGGLIFIKAGELHRSMDAGDARYEKITLSFPPSYLDSLQRLQQDVDLEAPFLKAIVLHVRHDELDYVERTLLRLLYEAEARPPGYHEECRLLVIQLLRFAQRAAANRTYEEQQPISLTGRLPEIVEYMNRHYQLPITLQSLSTKYHYNPSYLSTLFKTTTGFSIIEYLNGVRVKQAKRLLRETDQSIGSITDAVGFRSVTHFGRIFKQHTGYSPSRYRNS